MIHLLGKIEYLDEENKKKILTTDGFTSRIIQHEFDHLNGVLYTSRLVHKDAFGFSNEIEKYWKQNDEQK